VVTETKPEVRDWTAVLPPYKVLLHNDDHNAMDYVVLALLRSVPQLSAEEAVEIMWQAHMQGMALVVVCPLEQAELYRDRIKSYGLGCTIERDA
jgi:ATP-dependent Clp protease adaptor protein ClpS